MLFSFIIPFYNRYAELIRCINSILKGDISDAEIILIDDCSTEKGIEKLHKFIKGKNIIYKRFRKNKGPGIARSYGINFVKGDWIFFLDADDEVDSNVLTDVRKKLSATRKIDAITFSQITIINGDFISNVDIDKYSIASLIKTNMWHIDICRKVKDISIPLYHREDSCLGYLLWIQCKKNITLDYSFYKYYIAKNSLMTDIHSQKDLKRGLEAVYFLDKFYEQYNTIQYNTIQYKTKYFKKIYS
jgi:glycosyltransferase involved in cell wall biosynthesis